MLEQPQLTTATFFLPKPPPQTRPDFQRKPVRSYSFLCEDCLKVFEYLAYIIEEIRFERSKDKDSVPANVAVNHQNLLVWLVNYDSDCHFCYFLRLYLKGPPEWQQYLSEVQHEISWGSHLVNAQDQEDFKRGRLCVALTRKSLQRTHDNYHTYMRFQVGPSEDYAP